MMHWLALLTLHFVNILTNKPCLMRGVCVKNIGRKRGVTRCRNAMQKPYANAYRALRISASWQGKP
jgi:hypothetical protein